MEEKSMDELLHKWLEWDKDPSTRAEIEAMATHNKTGELEQCLRNRIQFGTAGLRGRMTAGFAYMNSLTVIQASQGIASYFTSSQAAQDVPPSPRSLSALIGHDTRHRSTSFARLAANAFRAKGVHVMLLEDYVPTPFISFGVRYFGKSPLNPTIGVMITASHNPAQDNGYKVYWTNGVQINTPLDEHIALSISENLEPWPNAWDVSAIEEEPTLQRSVLEELRSVYLDAMFLVDPVPASGDRSEVLAAYTPLHGVGWREMSALSEVYNHCSLQPVLAQLQPDPDFPTVKFPNPEEGGALDLALKTADDHGSRYVIANDPDADRFAAAEKLPNGTWQKFTGDQIGILLASFALERELACHASNPSRTSSPTRYAILTTAVSSRMLSRLAKALSSSSAAYSIHVFETLTGFKWLGNHAAFIATQGFTPLFAYEEALGYMFPSLSHDKDGLWAAATFLRAIRHWRNPDHGSLTPFAKLQRIYSEIGYHESVNTYFTSPSPSHTAHFFTALRAHPALTTMVLDDFQIMRYRDITCGVEVPDGAYSEHLPRDPGSQMLSFELRPRSPAGEINASAAGAGTHDYHGTIRVTLRASGTEPKTKLYLEAAHGTEADAQRLAGQAFQTVVREWVARRGLAHRDGWARSSSGVMWEVEPRPSGP